MQHFEEKTKMRIQIHTHTHTHLLYNDVGERQ